MGVDQAFEFLVSAQCVLPQIGIDSSIGGEVCTNL